MNYKIDPVFYVQGLKGVARFKKNVDQFENYTWISRNIHKFDGSYMNHMMYFCCLRTQRWGGLGEKLLLCKLVMIRYNHMFYSLSMTR